MSPARTLFDKIWDLHLIHARDDGEQLLFVDRNLIHEGPFYAFDALRREGRALRNPAQTFAFPDHYVPTVNRARGVDGIADPEMRRMVEQLARNAAESGIHHFGIDDALHDSDSVPAQAALRRIRKLPVSRRAFRRTRQSQRGLHPPSRKLVPCS